MKWFLYSENASELVWLSSFVKLDRGPPITRSVDQILLVSRSTGGASDCEFAILPDS